MKRNVAVARANRDDLCAPGVAEQANVQPFAETKSPLHAERCDPLPALGQIGFLTALRHQQHVGRLDFADLVQQIIDLVEIAGRLHDELELMPASGWRRAGGSRDLVTVGAT